MLYNTSLLLIYFIHSSLYLLIPYPYFAPLPSPLPTGTHWFVCFVNIVNKTMFLFCYINFFQIPHISDNIQYLSFFVWFISLSITLSRSIYVVANGRISFHLSLSNIPLCMYMCVCVCVCVCIYIIYIIYILYIYISYIYIYIYIYLTSLSIHLLIYT